MNTTTLIIHHGGDHSPAELRDVVMGILEEHEALRVDGIQYTDIDTILWTYAHEKEAGIVYHGDGYGGRTHIDILSRAGYGRHG